MARSLNLRTNALLSAARTDSIDVDASAAGAAQPALSKDAVAVIVTSLICLVFPLFLVLSRSLLHAAKPAAKILARLWTCLVLLGKRLKRLFGSSSGDSRSHPSQSGATASLLPPSDAASHSRND
jgi:hypothetical protein